jgi:hypothetical protein
MRTVRLAATAAALLLHASIGLGQVLETVSGFNDFPWGTSAAELQSTLGPAAHDETLEAGIRVYVYRDSVAGEESLAMYAVLDSLGMVKGQHTVRLDERVSCEVQYRSLRDHIKFLYPLLTPVENRENRSLADFCTALEEGAASWATQWKDPDTGSVVTVQLEAGAEAIKLIFESAQFIEWVAAIQPPGGA